MCDAYNTTWASSMRKDIDKRNRRNRDNAKQSTQTVTANLDININFMNSDGYRNMSYKGVFAIY